MPPARRTILLVDDDEDFLEIVKLDLSRMGLAVETAMDGVRAVSRALELRPDLILLDVMLPKLDGYHVAAKLSDSLGGECPGIIIMTARDAERERGLAKMSGAVQMLQKPFSMARLREMIERLLPPAAPTH